MYLPENTVKSKVYALFSFLSKAYFKHCFKMATSSLIIIHMIDDGK